MEWILFIVLTDPGARLQTKAAIQFETKALCDAALQQFTTTAGAFAKIELPPAIPLGGATPEKYREIPGRVIGEAPVYDRKDRLPGKGMGRGLAKLMQEGRLAPPLHERWGMCFQVKE